MSHTKRVTPELNSGSMADIAFLLLTFYMMTTVITEQKGLTLILPELNNIRTEPVHARNLFAININSQDKLMAEGKELKSILGLREVLKKFILNRGSSTAFSDSPEKAVVSIKTDRGTSYRKFLEALDEAQAAYIEIYADRARMSPDEFRKLNVKNPEQRKIYEQSRKGIPMNISIAEPTGLSR